MRPPECHTDALRLWRADVQVTGALRERGEEAGAAHHQRQSGYKLLKPKLYYLFGNAKSADSLESASFPVKMLPGLRPQELH